MAEYKISHGDVAKLREFCKEQDCNLLDLYQSVWATVMGNIPITKSSTVYLVSEGHASEDQDPCFHISHPATNSYFATIVAEVKANNRDRMSRATMRNNDLKHTRGLMFSQKLVPEQGASKASKTINRKEVKTYTVKINMSVAGSQPSIVMVTDVSKSLALQYTSAYEGLLEQITIDTNRTVGELLDQIQDFLPNPQPSESQLQASATFWTEQLSNSNTAIFPQLPTPIYSPMANKSVDRDSLTLNVSATMIRAAWALVSAQYTGLDNITFGLCDTQYGQATVPVQVNLNMEMPAMEFLEQIKKQSLAMQPFHKFDNIDRIRHIGGAAEAACAFQSRLVIRPEGKAVEISNSPYSLTVDCMLSSTGISVRALYDDAVVDEAQMSRTIHHFETILQRLSSEDSANMTIADVVIINEQDIAELFTRNKRLPPTVNKCVHHIIEERCKSQPDEPAVCAWNGNFTYKEINELSTRLGHHLRSLGVRPETFVPFCFEKSKWTPVTVLAIMKAGGVGVPLEPSHPIDRRKGMVEDVGAILTVCSKLQKSNCSGLPNLVVIDEDTVQNLPAKSGPVCTDVRPHNAAYMIFTSGSTGKPKGVVWEHKTLASSIAEHGNAFYFTRRPRVLQFAAHVFDISVGDTFTTLTFGGCMCIPSDADRMNNIVEFINRTKVDWTFFTPTFARLIRPEDIPGVKTVLLGGEKIGQDNVDNWRDKVQLIVCYGPAETCVYCSGNEVNIGNPKAESLGRTFGGRLWITDSTDPNNLSPIGVVGEILIEGPILARGYLNDPVKTADSFIFDPEWARRAGNGQRRRFYRTGDLGKYSADGTIAFVGRKDGQVKMRGQRMELGEVEHHLLHNDMVKHAITMVPKKGITEGTLVAVITLNSFVSKGVEGLQIISRSHKAEVARQIAAIRDYLADRLPGYMVPTVWLPMQDIPLNTSRKLDRPVVAQWVADISQQSLDEVADLLGQESVEGVSNSMEERLQQIWCRVLNLPAEKIGSNSAFLRLGGDSITAIQVTSRCRAENIELTVQDILRYKTLSQIALRAKESKTAISEVEELVETPFDLSPIQKFHFSRFASIENHFNQGFLLKVNQTLTLDQLRPAIEKVVTRHGMLRARFSWSESEKKWTQLISSQIEDSYQLTEHKIRSMAQLEPVVLATQSSFDLESGPLFGIALVNIPNQPQLLLLTGQHVVIDLVGWRVVMEDLEEAIISGDVKSTRSLPFSNWIQMQKDYTVKNVTTKSALPMEIAPANFEYWGMKDRPYLHEDVFKSQFSIDRETTQLLLGQCNEVMRTETVDLLLACVMYSFGKTFTDRDLPTIFNEGHGREEINVPADVSRTVGWFTIMAPISIRGADRNDLAQTIREIKDARHAISKHGFDYFSSRFLTEAGQEAFANHGEMEILFNYFGLYQQLERKDGLFSQMPPKTVNMHEFSPKLKEWALCEIEVGVEDGQLQLYFSHNRYMKHHTRILDWFEECKATVETLVSTLTHMESEFTLTDFPLLSLGYDSLNNIVHNILPEMGIETSNIEDIYPLSPMQEGILIAQTKQPESYRVKNTLKLSSNSGGTVDSNRLAQAWRRVVSRNAVLRSLIVSNASDNNLYQQVVLVDYEPRIFQVEADTHEEALMALDEYTPIDYNDATHSAHRFGICRLSNGDVYARLEISHTLIDLTSTSVLLEQIVQAYDDALPTGAGALYSDYISYLHNLDEHKALSYWKNYLEGITPCKFQLLNDGNVDPPVLNTVDIALDANSINEFCKSYGVTTNNLISAAWALLLQAYTGEETVCFGYLASGRDLPIRDVQQIFGPMINMLVCRVDLNSELPIIKVLEKIQADYVDGSDHQTCSLGAIQHALQLGGVKLFNTAISLDKIPTQSFNKKRSVSVEEIGLYDPTDIELVLNVAYSDTEIRSAITYSTAWISDKNAHNVADTFAMIIKSIVQSPEKPTCKVEKVGPHTLNQLVAWNADCPGVLDVCVHEEFHKQALLHPDLPALCSWDGEMTYKTLDDLSTRLSHYLARLGVGLEIVVPLAFEKSMWVIVSQLAVLKAGGACLTMDMSHPVDRLEGLCKQVGAKLLLLAPNMAEKFKDVVIEKLMIDEEFVTTLPPKRKFACITTRPNNMGFVVFTSGSTGQPKGIMLEHKTVCTSSRGHQKVFNVGPGSRCYQFSAFAFDVHISDIFTPLMYGGCCCVPSEMDRLNDLPGSITRLNANRTYITPTVATVFRPEDAPCLKMAALGGEPLTKENAKIWAGKVHLINVFGPSETSNWVSYLVVKPDTTQPSNIGPGNDCNVWLVDHITNSRLVPIGCVGEMFVESPTLARGYYNEPEKTKAAFLENPSWLPDDGSGKVRRVYGTGDLVRANSDGTLLYVGRADSQIKLHGQRIELGEVEYAIVECPEVKHVSVVLPKEGICKGKLFAVIALEDPYEIPGTKPLDIIPSSHKTAIQAKIASIMDTIAAKLPAWMNPHHWAFVSSIPASASGKLDRALVKKWVAGIDEATLAQISDLTAVTDVEMPVTPMEKALQELWSPILKLPLDQIGRDSSFLRLGGDSFLVMLLVGKARGQDIALKTADVFSNPKLRDMALAAKSSQFTAVLEPLAPFNMVQPEFLDQVVREAAMKCEIQEDDIQDIYPATPLQEGLMALSLAQPGAFVAQNVYELPRDLDRETFSQAWKQIYTAHPILRTRVINTDSFGTMQVVLDEEIKWHMGHGLDKYLENDRKTPMLLGDSLARFAIVDNHFIMTAHHAVYDGWSLSALLEDVTKAYNQQEVQERTPYKHFIQHIQETDQTAADAFWMSQFSESNTCIFPVLPSAAYQPNASTLVVQDINITRKAGSNITTSTILRAAWALVVSQYMAAENVTFGLLLSGRNAAIPGITEMMGPTISTVPVQIQVDGTCDRSEFLSKIQEQSIAMMPFEQTGLQRIRKLGGEAELACEFQTQLVIQPAGAQSKGLGAIGIQQVNDPADDKLTYLITLECVLTKKGVTVNALFDDNVVAPAQMKRYLQQFEHIITQLCVEQGSGTVADVMTINSHDLKDISGWNKVQAPVINELVHNSFQKQVAMQPQCPAVNSWDGDFTYEELDTFSNYLGGYLRQLGVRPEIYVSLCFEKTKWFIVATLAIMKAGGVCVPLDPTHPEERKKAMMAEVSCTILLTSESQSTPCAGLAQKVVAICDTTMNMLSVFNNAIVCDDVTPNNAVYVIFTSGSTGKPKAVVWEHRTLSSSLAKHRKALHFDGTKRRFLQLASTAFDASVGEILMPLLCGGCVCIPAEQDKLSKVVEYIATMKVDMTFLTPTFARLLDPRDVPTLKTLILGGEAIGQDNIEKWSQELHLINAYGPTECCILACTNEFTSPNQTPDVIGETCGGSIWIVDSSNINKLLPIGAVGEILIEGATVAREYLNNKEKTAESFVQDLVWARNSSTKRRFYRTGDLGKLNGDGSVAFVGRKDNQIKLHGQRMELGEVEHHLSQSGLIRHVAVLIPKTGVYAGRLVAVFALSAFDAPTERNAKFQIISGENAKAVSTQVSQIIRYMEDKLPPYMIPSDWVPLQDIPLTATGKLDRVSTTLWLTKLERASADEISTLVSGGEDSHVMPTTQKERDMQEVWCKVLGLSPSEVGTNTSFIKLGGDSISAIQVTSRCRAKNLDIAVQDILRYKTISLIAEHAQIVQSSVVNIEEELDTEFELSPIQRLYFGQLSDIAPSKVNQHYFNQSFLLQVKRNVALKDLQQAFDVLISQHSMLRARFTWVQDQQKWTQHVTSEFRDAYFLRSHTIQNVNAMEPFIVKAQASLNIQSGPVFSADLFNVESAPAKQLLFITAHHLIIDLVSWRIIIQDLEELLTSGTLSAVSESLPFQRWVDMQAQFARNNTSSTYLPFTVPASNFAYWGMEKKQNLVQDQIEKSFTVNREQSEAILLSANEPLNTEPLDLLISSMLYAFGQTFKDRSLPAVFNESHGREPWESSVDLSRTVGWFTTLCPLAVDADKDDLIQIVREVKDRRRGITNNGWHYFNSRYLTEQGATEYAGHENMEIVFNYAGAYQQFEREDSLLSIAPANTVNLHEQSKQSKQFSLFSVGIAVVQGELQFTFSYNRLMKNQEGITRWIKNCEEAVTEIIRQTKTSPAQFTLSDFPLLPIKYSDLDTISNTVLPQLEVDEVGEIEDIYPCSPIQAGMLSAQARQSSHYKIESIFKIVPKSSAQPVSISTLERAWEAVVARHPIMRTIFIAGLSEDSAFDQVVLKQRSPRTCSIEVANETDVVRELRAFESINYNEYEPAHRLIFCNTSDGSVYCRLEMSHALADAVSLQILLKEVCLAYDRRLPRSPGPLYSDYIAHIQKQPPGASLNYWKNLLAEAKPCHFPTFNSESAAEIEGSRNVSSIDATLPCAKDLFAFCVSNGFTVMNIIQAAWALVLQTYTGEHSPCFGYLGSGRDMPIPNVESSIGPLINMLVCRVDLSHESTVDDVLNQVQADYISSLPHQVTSLAEIQHALGLDGEHLFNTGVSLQKKTTEASQESSIKFDMVDGYDPSDFDIVVNATYSDSAFEATFSYVESVIPHTYMGYIIDTFNVIVKSLISSAKQSVGDVERFGPENHQQLSRWNEFLPPAVDECVHEKIMQRAKSHPKEPAVCSWDGDLSYRQLDEYSTRLANYLHSIGVGPEMFVPFLFEKSRWTIVAIVGILKAGGACVPLEPSHPLERKREIVESVKAKIMLTSEMHSQSCVGLVEKTVVVSKTTLKGLSGATRSFNMDSRTSKAAYAIFTSGSTGKPKAVVWEHKNLSSGISYHGEGLHLHDQPRVLQFASHVFDASALEVLTTLCFGGCICIPADDDKMANLTSYINKFGVNWAFMTPTLARLVDPKDVPTLKTLILGGEPIGYDNINRWGSKLTLINGYGPSECSICCAANVIVPGTSSANPESIGLPVGSRIWITDSTDSNKLLPIGAMGEIVVEGPILARGYMNAKQKTAESFIVDPQWSRVEGKESGRRFYRTGDLARRRLDGTISFGGRKDNQVKIRGQRMEIGEVEHHILSNSSVEHVVVVAPKSGCCDGRLVATLTISDYVKTNGRPPLTLCSNSQKDLVSRTISKLQDLLSEKLPSYMVPTVWMAMEEMPMTTTGKLDRVSVQNWVVALPRETLDKVLQSLSNKKELGQPRTEVEKDMQEVWSDILGIPAEQIGTDSSFIKLGGDSIMALKMIPKCRSKHIGLTVHDILRYETISKIAEHATIMEGRAVTYAASIAEVASILETPTTPTNIKKEEEAVITSPQAQRLEVPSTASAEAKGKEKKESSTDKEDIKFSLSQAQQMSIRRLSAHGKHCNFSHLLKLKKNVTIANLRAALDTLVRTHPILRARFEHANSEWVQTISPDIEDSYELQSHDVMSLKTMDSIIRQTQKRIDLEVGPLFAADLFTVNPRLENYQLLFLTAHRLIVDADSWEILLEDIGTLLSTGELHSRKAVPYQAWVKMQSSEKLANSAANKVVEISRPDYNFWGMTGKILLQRNYSEAEFTLGALKTEQLFASSDKKRSADPKDTVLAAMIHAFSKTFGSRVPVIYEEESGRQQGSITADLSRTVGLLSTLSPISVSSAEQNNTFQTISQIKASRASVRDCGWTASHDGMEILFNFSTTQRKIFDDSAMTGLHFMSLHEQSTRLEQPALINIKVTLVNDELRFHGAYNSLMKHQDKIRAWIASCSTVLEDMIDEISKASNTSSVADFPGLDLSEEELHTILAAVKVQMPMSQSNIEDIVPATYYQTTSLANTLSKRRGDMNYLICEMNGPLNVPLLVNSCQELIARHPVLRTGFVASQHRIFQVILAKGLFDFCEHVGEPHTEARPSAHIVKDSEETFSLGELHPRFMLIEHGSDHNSLVIRLPHALYDAISMGVLVEDLQGLYSGAANMVLPGFGNYATFVKENKIQAEEYWRSYLEGSTITSLQSRAKPVFSGCGFATVKKQITPKSLQSHGISTATLVKSAWAYVLSQVSRKQDVVMGDLVNGRNAPVEGIEKMTRVCLNMIPLRINLETSKTVLSLLKTVQARQLESMPFDFLDTSDIINRCTNWTSWAGFGSTVNHTINSISQDSTISVGNEGLEWKYNSFTRGGEIPLIEIESHPNGSALDIEINFGDAIFPPEFVKELLESLCNTIMRFSNDVNANISPSANPDLPVSHVSTGRSFGPIKSSMSPAAPPIDDAIKLLVQRVWAVTMSVNQHPQLLSKVTNTTPFYSIWEQPIAAAHFVSQYRQEGINLNMEDIFAAPTMSSQMALCSGIAIK